MEQLALPGQKQGKTRKPDGSQVRFVDQAKETHELPPGMNPIHNNFSIKGRA